MNRNIHKQKLSQVHDEKAINIIKSTQFYPITT